MDEQFRDVVLDVAAPVATLLLNRPAKLNAVTPQMTDALRAHADRINTDSEIRVVLLTGAGEKAFCAGSDIRELNAYDTAWEFRGRPDYCDAVRSIRKPVIAVVNGYAYGGGLELAMSADIRLASHTASFAAPEIKLGWVGGGGISALLAHSAGASNAALMLYTGDPVDAATALSWGLVSQLHEPANLLPAAHDLASRIAQRPPVAAQTAKLNLRAAYAMPLENAIQYERDLQTICFATEDAAEGRAAFAEKRTPHFRGRLAMAASAPVPSFDLGDQVALITGAGRGIGAAIGRAAAAAGAHAVLSARSVPQLEAVAGEIRAAGGLADVLPWDLAGPDPAGLVTACLQRHGRVDVLVHAAGNQVRKPLFDYTPGDFDALLAVHLRAAFLLAQAAGRDMAARGGGAIVFVGSLTSERLGNPSTVGYAAAKSGLLGLMRTFAVALAPYGVRVNTLIPGFVTTELTRDVDGTPERARLTGRVPLGRLGVPADLAGPAVFLASPAAAYVTGATLTVDGGWSAA